MRPFRLLRDDRGAVAVEFALVFPVLMIIVFGIIDFSRAFFAMNNLTSAVREGARYASVQVDPVAQTGAIKKVVADYWYQYGSGALDTSKITVNFIDNAKVEVTVSDYPFTLLTPLVNVVGLDTIPMSRRAVFRWEREDAVGGGGGG